MLQNDLILSLSVIVGKDAVLSGESATPYCSDWRGRYSGNALAVVFPSDTQQVSGVVKLCAANNVAIVPQGGNTSLCGGSVPLSQSLGGGQIVLNLSRMNQFRSIDPINYTMTVEAGCKLADVREAAEKNNRFSSVGTDSHTKILRDWRQPFDQCGRYQCAALRQYARLGARAGSCVAGRTHLERLAQPAQG